ncbi:MAG: M23 family metallopeptidase [Synergistaceae bacterium]|nr:M23 family metallopeptidase [Synergistaceae bacterium]
MTLAFSLWGAFPSRAEETVLIWDEDRQKLEELCLARGISLLNVFEANGWDGPPPQGETLRVPASKREALLIQMEAVSRKNAPLVTVKLHGVPQIAEVLQNTEEKSAPVVKKEKMEEKAEKEEKLAFLPLLVSPIPEPPRETPETPALKPDSSATLEKESSEARVSEEDELEENMPLFMEGLSIPRPIPDGLSAEEIIAALGSPDLSPPPEFLPGVRRVVPRPIVNGDAALLGTMMWPVDGRITSGFGPRRRRWHMGLDIPMVRGTPIRAAREGVVTVVSLGYRGYGNSVMLDHGGGLVTMYAHCQKITVRKGQNIRQGDVVALVGNSGRATTNHLHFEVRKDGKPVNPIPYLTPR